MHCSLHSRCKVNIMPGCLALLCHSRGVRWVGVGRPTCAATHDGAWAAGTLSQNGTKGLMSNTGLPSTMSAPASVNVRPSTHTTRATLRPMGHGLASGKGQRKMEAVGWVGAPRPGGCSAWSYYPWPAAPCNRKEGSPGPRAQPRTCAASGSQTPRACHHPGGAPCRGGKQCSCLRRYPVKSMARCPSERQHSPRARAVRRLGGH